MTEVKETCFSARVEFDGNRRGAGDSEYRLLTIRFVGGETISPEASAGCGT